MKIPNTIAILKDAPHRGTMAKRIIRVLLLIGLVTLIFMLYKDS